MMWIVNNGSDNNVIRTTIFLWLLVFLAACDTQNASKSSLNTLEPSDGETALFSLSSSHQTIPEDILREVSLFLGGVGGGDICGKGIGVFSIDEPEHGNSVELGQKIHFAICGWQREDSIVTVTLPNGQSEFIEAKYYGDGADGVSQIMFVFYPGINDPVGTYTFAFPGYEHEPQVSVEVIEPTGPRLIWDKPDDRITLFNFNPNELIRLLAYKSTENKLFVGALVGWQVYKADSKGQLIIQTDEDSVVDGFAAIGDSSGLAESFMILDESKLVFMHLIRTSQLDIFNTGE